MTREEAAIKWLKHCAETDCDDCACEIQPIEWCSEKMACCISVLEEALSEDISEDGTLKVKVKDGSKVNRVLVLGDNNFGGLYYPE